MVLEQITDKESQIQSMNPPCKLAMFLASLLALFATAVLLTSCSQAQAPSNEAPSPVERADEQPQKVIAGSLPPHYEKVGVSEDTIDVFEDGYRTHGDEGTYEWWYFDASFEDGTSLVITFYTRSMMNPDAELSPFVTLSLTYPDGTKVEERVSVLASEFSSSTEKCDIQLGGCSAEGDLKNYRVVFENERISAEVTLVSNVASWRQATGYRFYGNSEEYYAAWLCVVPEGSVSATVTLDGESRTYRGTGYHDHNWGNHPVWEMQNDWYWGRVEAGPYVAITSSITTAEMYGFKRFPLFMLAKDGVVVTDNPDGFGFEANDNTFDPDTGIPIASEVKFTCTVGDTEYRVSYFLRKTILATSMMPALSESQQQQAKEAGNLMMYYRFVGDATIEVYEGGELIDKQATDNALWELMYPGVIRWAEDGTGAEQS